MIQKIISTIINNESKNKEIFDNNNELKNKEIFDIIKESLDFHLMLNSHSNSIKQEVENALKSISEKKDKQAKYILFWIELFRQDKNQHYRDTNNLDYNYEVEHLMPKKWETNWNIGKSEDDMKKLIYQIGNMTLLKKKLNATIGNSVWETKLNGDGNTRVQYIRKNASLIINKELLDKKEWGEKEIKERTKQLIKDFFQIWTYDDSGLSLDDHGLSLFDFG